MIKLNVCTPLPLTDYELLSSFLLYCNTVGFNKLNTSLSGHMKRLEVVNHVHSKCISIPATS